MMKIFLFILGAFFVFCLLDTLRTVFLITRSSQLVKSAVPFQRIILGANMRILVMGDSTAYGTGAESPAGSTAGRLAQFYPDSEIINRSENGLKIEGLLKKIDAFDEDEKFDLVLIQIGANDIIRFTSFGTIENGIDTILVRMETIGKKVIVLHSGDIGDGPFFPLYLRPFLSHRSFRVREIYQKATSRHGASYVDLIDSTVPEKIRGNKDIYYSKDLLHLSSAGYSLWFDEIRKFLIQE